MSHRNLTSVFSLAAVALFAMAVTLPASANAGHTATDTNTGYGTTQGSPMEPSCYTEPSGFHKNIHWDSACHNTQKTERAAAESVETTKSNFVKPSGFHYNVRSK